MKRDLRSLSSLRSWGSLRFFLPWLLLRKLISWQMQEDVFVSIIGHSLLKKYESHLVAIGEEQSETLFAGFIMEEGENICPSHGTITIVTQNLLCSVHDIDEDEDDGPYLLK